MGYISGYIDSVVQKQPVDGQKALCFPPAGNSYDQDILVVVKWLNDHPEKLHLLKPDAIEQALADAFPCDN
jgi:hypothetical protein